MSFSDSFNLFSKTTPHKWWNAQKTLTSYYRSRHFHSFQNPGLPISIAFEPTTSCNLRCPECPSGLRSFTRPTGMLNKDFFKDKIEEMQAHLLYLTFYFQGEPFLHPDFLEMVHVAQKNNIYTATSTNAHFLDDEKAEATVKSGLDRLIVSIDGTTQETYEQYRIGGQLEKVLEGTRNIVRWKRKLKSKTPHVIFQFLVVRPNEHQIEEARKLAREIGVNDIHFKTAQIYDFQQGSDLIPENDQYSRYKKNGANKFTLKNPLHDHCWKMWHSCVVTWDGKVVPCCFDKDASHVMGDLNQQSMNKIWYGSVYENFRKQILTSRGEIDICKNCSEGLKVSMTD